jgi:hypothetical protein
MSGGDVPVVQVEQCDREAAAAWLNMWDVAVPHDTIRHGKRDRHTLVQAFARHRAAAVAGVGWQGDESELRALLDRIAELEHEAKLFDEDHADQNRMVDRIAELIGLPHDQELDTTAFEAWFSRAIGKGRQDDKESLIDFFDEALSESLEAEWTTRKGAKHCAGMIERAGLCLMPVACTDEMLDAKDARIAELEAALRPIAEMCDFFAVGHHGQVSARDLRRVAEALSATARRESGEGVE